MTRVLATVRGISPLLMCPMSEEVLEGIRTKTPAPRRTDWSREEEAESKLYRDDDGAIGIPSLNLFACLVEAGRLVKVNGRQISTATSTSLPSMLSIDEFFLPFKGRVSWRADMRRGRNEKRQAIAVVRPMFKKWEFDMTLEINENEINEDTARQIVETAGTKVGLCSFRPNNRGPFGRFKVVAWVKQDGSRNGRVRVERKKLAGTTAR